MDKRSQATYTYKCGHSNTEYYAKGISASEIKNYQAHRSLRACPNCESEQARTSSNLHPIFDGICKSFFGEG